MFLFLFKLKVYLKIFLFRLSEAVFVTKNQYRLRLLHCYEASTNQIIGVVQVVIKRVKAKFSIRYLAYNEKILLDIHPVNACKLSFIANLESEVKLETIPPQMKISTISCSIIKQPPTLKIISQSFHHEGNDTLFTITDKNSNFTKTLTADELAQNHQLLYSIGSHAAARVGIAASNDFLKKLTTTQKINSEKTAVITSAKTPKFFYYHILCIAYITLILTGMSIVRRMFPFHIPFTDLIIPFGGGIIFFPIVFCIQDITTCNAPH